MIKLNNMFLPFLEKVLFVFIFLMSGVAEVIAGTSPPDPGSDPTGGGIPPVGGGAPLTDSGGVLFMLAVGYLVWKFIAMFVSKRKAQVLTKNLSSSNYAN